MNSKQKILIEIVRANSYKRAIDYLIFHCKKFGLSDKETSKEVLKLLLEKLEDKNEFN